MNPSIGKPQSWVWSALAHLLIRDPIERHFVLHGVGSFVPLSTLRDLSAPFPTQRKRSQTLADIRGFSGYPQYSQAKVQKIGGSKNIFAPAVWKFHALEFSS
jgi:hypothetical protein